MIENKSYNLIEDDNSVVSVDVIGSDGSFVYFSDNTSMTIQEFNNRIVENNIPVDNIPIMKDNRPQISEQVVGSDLILPVNSDHEEPTSKPDKLLTSLFKRLKRSKVDINVTIPIDLPSADGVSMIVDNFEINNEELVSMLMPQDSKYINRIVSEAILSHLGIKEHGEENNKDNQIQQD